MHWFCFVDSLKKREIFSFLKYLSFFLFRPYITGLKAKSMQISQMKVLYLFEVYAKKLSYLFSVPFHATCDRNIPSIGVRNTSWIKKKPRNKPHLEDNLDSIFFHQ